MFKLNLVCHGEERTPEALTAGVLRAVTALRQSGLGEGDVLGLWMHNGAVMYELLLAARWIGAYWCPINWHLKRDEVAHILSDSGARVLVAEQALWQTAADAAPAGLKVLVFGPASDDAALSHAELSAVPSWAALCERALPDPQPAATPRSAMLYTSGTTGRPKGIRRQPATPAQAADGMARLRQVVGCQEGMRALVSAPLYHSAPLSFAMVVAQLGGTLVLEERFDPEQTLRLIEAHAITHAYLVPTMYVRLLRLPDEVKRRHDLRSLSFVSSTGSPCPPEVKRAMIDWWGPVIHEAYGSSELGYMTLLTSEQAQRKPGSAGKALPGVHLRILDEQGHALPAGQAGQIFVRPDMLADFTYNHSEGARRAMERDGYMTMGDVGYLDDEGFLFIVDRSADMVISGGVNIYPAEIETVLHGMPGVADCAVFGIPDAEFGEALAAAVQGVEGTQLDEQQVRDWLRPRVANYKLPRVVSFHTALPREDTGKIFKRKLREPYWLGVKRRI